MSAVAAWERHEACGCDRSEGSYSSISAAQLACVDNPECYAIVNHHSDGHDFQLCGHQSLPYGADYGGHESGNIVYSLSGHAPPSPCFVVNSGPCTTSEGGRCVGRPDGYLPNEECEIEVGGASGLLGPCSVFDINGNGDSVNDCGGSCEDNLFMPDGTPHSASDCPVGAHVAPGQTLTWHSDSNGQGSHGDGLPWSQDGVGGGWQICVAHSTAGLPAWDSGALRSTGNPAGAAFTLYKLPATTGWGGAGGDAIDYTAACAEYGLQGIGCFSFESGWPDLTEYHPLGMHMPREFGCEMYSGDHHWGADGGGDADRDLGSSTGWTDLLFYDGDSGGSSLPLDVAQRLNGMANDGEGWDGHTDIPRSPVCALAALPCCSSSCASDGGCCSDSSCGGHLGCDNCACGDGLCGSAPSWCDENHPGWDNTWIGRADIDGNIVTAARVDVPLSIEAAVALRVHHQLIMQVAGASLSSGCCEEQLSSWMRSKLLRDDEYISVESILYAHTP